MQKMRDKKNTIKHIESKQHKDKSPSLSLITLNLNDLNALIKRKSLAEWIKTHDLTICCLQETHLRSKNKIRLRSNGSKKMFHANSSQKRAGVAILISDKQT